MLVTQEADLNLSHSWVHFPSVGCESPSGHPLRPGKVTQRPSGFFWAWCSRNKGYIILCLEAHHYHLPTSIFILVKTGIMHIKERKEGIGMLQMLAFSCLPGSGPQSAFWDPEREILPACLRSIFTNSRAALEMERPDNPSF